MTKEKFREYHRKYCRSHRVQRSKQHKEWALRHPDKARNGQKKYREKNKLKIREREKQWRINHPEKHKQCMHRCYLKINVTVMGNLNKRIGTAVWRSLRNLKNGIDWEILVGYKIEDLRKHLELKFTEGMTWERFLNGEIHVDHIFPLSRLIIDSSGDPTFKFAWSLNNLQPLWKEENIRKRDKVA